MPSTAAEATVINPESIDEDYIHVVAAVIWRGTDPRQFLIARRPEGKHLADLWEFPGGKREPGESPRAALDRELAEEISIRPRAASPLIRVYHRYPDRNVLLDTWVVERFDGEVSARERQPLRWIAVDEIDAYDFPAADLPILDLIRNSATAETRRLP